MSAAWPEAALKLQFIRDPQRLQRTPVANRWRENEIHATNVPGFNASGVHLITVLKARNRTTWHLEDARTRRLGSLLRVAQPSWLRVPAASSRRF
jgi:hypothetical protein